MNDLISRKAAIKAIRKDMYADKDFMSAMICEGIECMLNSVPSAEPPRGFWVTIERGEQGYSAGDFRCSICGEPNKCYTLTAFCPNCGAKMEGKK